MKNFFILALIAFVSIANAQSGRTPNLKSDAIDPYEMWGSSYAEITEYLDAHFEANPPIRTEEGAILDGDFTRYQRWKHYWYYRLDENGEFPQVEQEQAVFKLRQELAQQRATASAQRADNEWVLKGPFTREGGYWGMGRVTDIAFHPTDAGTFYVGAAKGGIWKTTNGGNSYTSLGDELPYNSVGNIVVNKDNPDILLVTLGDRAGWWMHGIGVYRSEDGGATWAATDLTFNLSEETALPDMKASPVNSNFVLVATAQGLFRSVDGGSSFLEVNIGLPGTSTSTIYPREVVFHPTDPDVAYVSWFDYWASTGGIFRTEDGGTTWTNVSGMTITPRIAFSLAISETAPDRLVAKYSKDGIRYMRSSYDRGDTWTDMPQYNDMDGDLIYVSPVDDEVIYSGYFYVWRSTDNGNLFERFAAWDVNWIHVDHWVITHNPLDGKMYWGNDGGVYSLDEFTGTWTELNEGLAISQLYETSIAQDISDYFIIGTQDNGGALHEPGNVWLNTNGGDAMTSAMDPNDYNKFLTTYPLGYEIYRTSNGWTTNQRIENNLPSDYTGNADWLTPIAMNPHNSDHIMAVTNHVYMSYDYGNTWSKTTSNLSGSNKMKKIEVSPADPNSIYAFANNTLYESADGGATWDSHIQGVNISNFDLHPSNPDVVYLTRAGYNNGNKVFYSTDRGETWDNISGSLPNIPALSVLYDEYDNTLYLGTELGVYKSDASLINWQIMDGLPLTQINDLELQIEDRVLYAATYGRGLWAMDMKVPSYDPQVSGIDIKLTYNSEFATLLGIPNDAVLELLSIDGRLLVKNESGNGQISLSGLVNGTYLISVQSEGQQIWADKIVYTR